MSCLNGETLPATQTFRLSPVPLGPHRHGDVPRPDWPFPPTTLPSCPIRSGRFTNRPHSAPTSDGARTPFHAPSAREYCVTFPHYVIRTLPEGRYYQSLRWRTIWCTLVPRWLFNDYRFMVQLLAAFPTMAVRNRVESSSAPPIYTSPWLYGS